MVRAVRLPLSFASEHPLANLQKLEKEIKWHDYRDCTVVNAGDLGLRHLKHALTGGNRRSSRAR
jgi:hypothetical protein